MFTILGTDGKEYGPVTAGKVHEWIAGGRANLQTKARRSGETDWKTLGDFPEFGEFGANSGAGNPPAPATTAAIESESAVAPVAPEVEVEPSKLSLRFLAAFIDGIIKTLCYLPITIPLSRVLFAQARTGEQTSFAETARMMTEAFDANLKHALPLLMALLLVQLWLLTRRGQSIGKLLLGLRIVRQADGVQAGFLHAFLLRGTLPFLLEQIPLLGFLFWIMDSCFIFRDDRRCLHDLLAGTRVVQA